MIEGFCTLELSNVAATVDRRCVNDNSLVVAPSTFCAHRQWLGVDGWSACVQVNPCKPRPADAWRAILSQQEKAVKRRDDEHAALQTLRRARARQQPSPEIPCPVCTTPFSERLSARSSTRKTCSAACGRVLRNRVVTAAKRPARPPALTTSGREASQIVTSICAEHRQEMRNGQPIRTSCRACDRHAERRALGVQSRPSTRFTTTKRPPVQRACQQCYAVFAVPRKRPNQRYCSIRCHNQARGTLPRQRTCSICQGQFRPRRSAARFCSIACRSASRQGTKPLAAIAARVKQQRIPVQPCPICGADFKPLSNGRAKARQATCSLHCGLVWAARHRKPETAPCRHCSQPVPRYTYRRATGKVDVKSFCSRACFDAFRTNGYGDLLGLLTHDWQPVPPIAKRLGRLPQTVRTRLQRAHAKGLVEFKRGHGYRRTPGVAA